MSTKAKSYLEKNCGKLSLGGALRAIRQSDDITQTAFAKKLKVSSQFLCDLELGRKIISPKKAKQFAQILGYPPEQFVILAIQDSLDHDGIRMLVEIKVA